MSYFDNYDNKCSNKYEMNHKNRKKIIYVILLIIDSDLNVI
jgi:hypothetical protein